MSEKSIESVAVDAELTTLESAPGADRSHPGSHSKTAFLVAKLIFFSQMVPFDILQCPHTRNLQFSRPRNMGSHELSWSRWPARALPR